MASWTASRRSVAGSDAATPGDSETSSARLCMTALASNRESFGLRRSRQLVSRRAGPRAGTWAPARQAGTGRRYWSSPPSDTGSHRSAGTGTMIRAQLNTSAVTEPQWREPARRHAPCCRSGHAPACGRRRSRRRPGGRPACSSSTAWSMAANQSGIMVRAYGRTSRRRPGRRPRANFVASASMQRSRCVQPFCVDSRRRHVRASSGRDRPRRPCPSEPSRAPSKLERSRRCPRPSSSHRPRRRAPAARRTSSLAAVQ